LRRVICLAVLLFAATVTNSHAEDATQPFPVPIYDTPRMVFFGPQSAVVSDKANSVLEFAVQIAAHYQATVEQVTAYCDTAEIAAGSCETLARRRGEAVKAALLRLGLKARIRVRISTEQLAPPGYHEIPALNRRVVVEPL